MAAFRAAAVKHSPIQLISYRVLPDDMESVALAHRNLGIMFEEKKDWSAAIAAHRQAVLFTPESAFSHVNLGIALFKSGDLDGALSSCREATRLNNKLSIAHNVSGLVLSRKGDTTGAIRSFTDAIASDKKNDSAFSNRANAYVKNGETYKAAADYYEASRLNPERKAEYDTFIKGLKTPLPKADFLSVTVPYGWVGRKPLG